MSSEEQKVGTRCFSIRLEETINDGQHLASDSSKVTGNREENTNCKSDEQPLYFPNGLDPRSLFGSFRGASATNSALELRVAVATQFQRSFMKLLRDAQFEELSAQDLLLAYALNNDYLLTLPIYVDWKKASESNAIIFRRGYATERQKGLLIVEKLDYLQSKLLQKIFFSLSRPLKKIGSWFNEALKSLNEAQDMQPWIEKMKTWLKEQYLPESAGLHGENISKNQFEYDQIEDGDLPIWLAAQRAVSRYEGFLSPVGPRGRLIRRLLTWIGLIPSLPEASIDFDNDDKYSETYLSLVLNQEPALQELILLYTERTSQTNSEDKAEILPLQLKIYQRIPIPDLPVRLDVATLLGLLAYFVNYKFENILSSPDMCSKADNLYGLKCLGLKQGYDLFTISQKSVNGRGMVKEQNPKKEKRSHGWGIEGILSSGMQPLPCQSSMLARSAVFLDVIAVSALVIYVSRVVLGYKQTWDRYQLLVNRTLYEKTLASGFGSVHFLLDASEQQQYKEAILVYALLLHPARLVNVVAFVVGVLAGQVSCPKRMKDACERFMYDKFKEKIEMPIDKAVNTLLRLELVTEFPLERSLQLEALPCSEACETLRKRWDGLLKQRT
ncbi:hypothetical protein COCNU_08G007440 [Cocos nucifera]|uniref:Uncharacterized protein n=1 Tax=Cocos nucifera TaxID=13894 RepID=A0A8K0IHT4_COCNU|nr:hypothetical protein COCNU_08G007440 [Cocos nucifera]